MAEYIDIDKNVIVYDTRGGMHEVTVRHILSMNRGEFEVDDVRPVKRGRWVPVGLDDVDEGMFKCSECGSEHFFPEILMGIHADNYCSDCGADMRPTLMSGANGEES